MVSATDYQHRNDLLGTDEDSPKKRRGFRLLSALAAPFKDVDERAIKRGKHARNKIIGAPFANQGPLARVKARGKPFPRGGD